MNHLRLLDLHCNTQMNAIGAVYLPGPEGAHSAPAADQDFTADPPVETTPCSLEAPFLALNAYALNSPSLCAAPLDIGRCYIDLGEMVHFYSREIYWRGYFIGRRPFFYTYLHSAECFQVHLPRYTPSYNPEDLPTVLC